MTTGELITLLTLTVAIVMAAMSVTGVVVYRHRQRQIRKDAGL